MPLSGDFFSYEHAGLEGLRGESPISVEPFSSLDLADNDQVLDWLTQASQELHDFYRSYHSLYRDNINVYSGHSLSDGLQWNGQAFFRRDSHNKHSTNLIRPIIETHVSRLTSSRAHISVLPVHSSDFHDLSAAKTAESMVNMSFIDRKVDQKLENAARCMLVCGAAYMVMEWDSTIGPPMPSLQEGVPVLDDQGNPKRDEHDNPIMIRPDIRVGDVNYRVLRPDQVLEQPGRWGENTDWVITIEMVDLYRLRERFPTMTDKILASDNGGYNNLRRTSDKQTVLYTLYHRATPSLPHGRMIIATSDVILENRDMPFPTLNKYGKLPIARLSDMQLPGHDLPLPLTVMESGKPYHHLHNKVNQNILRNLSVQSPKWIVNSAAGVRLTHLSNASNIVQYKGDASMAPRIDSPRTVPSEMFAYRDTLGNEMQVVTGASHILNVPPPNTRAATMLEHQEEQEFKRAEPLIKHYNDFQSDIAQISLAIMADMYDETDERMLKLSAHGSSTAFIRLKIADLIGPFDIRFERTSALPESKQGRLNEAARMFQMGLIDDVQYKKVIGYDADPELATAESKAQEKQMLEMDLITRMHEVQPPVEHEDHVEHLRILYPVMESIEFAEMPPEVQERLVAHCMAHEMFAWRRAQISPVYAVKVLQHVKWMFFSALPEAMPVSMNVPGTPLDQTVGEQLTTPGLVPGGGASILPQQPGPNNPEGI